MSKLLEVVVAYRARLGSLSNYFDVLETIRLIFDGLFYNNKQLSEVIDF